MVVLETETGGGFAVECAKAAYMKFGLLLLHLSHIEARDGWTSINVRLGDWVSK
jgi:hypothetical protein